VLTRVRDGAYDYIERPRPASIRKRAGEAETETIRFGTTFGVELGQAFEVSKDGTVVKKQKLPLRSFQKEIPPPPRRRSEMSEAASGK
jgi:hypothetical protein